ncbi:PREDICTED: NLR family CARD domain-containing protein 4 [Charadrius vociferus]|uniref:NLR family CARD domain-containing protein 4 n=1 Tax=Charadrius vociferus TaxID=50402 RepID=UPI0005215BB8|nr:PREDICTED: NLR family CARD domain-containing protein 4 [Charadrius vociferus]
MGMITVKQIADDLLACNVMSCEEVNTIACEKVEQEASRMMIYMILNKGSEACNILVRSLEKHNPFLFHDLQGYCTIGQVEQDKLNYLIQDLKYVYLSSAFQKYHPLGSDIDIIFDLGTAYTDILLWKKDIHNSRKGQLTLNVLLEELKNPCIIEGEAGKGKTTLLKRIAVLWASGNSSALKKFQFVFFISLTSTRGGIYETVCDQLLFEQYPICKQDFMKMLLAQRQRVLFLLDGYDEFKPPNCPEMEAMIKENHKFKNMVIISTRTECIHKIRQFGSLIAEIGDLSEESCKKLIKNVLTNKLADGLINQLKEVTSMKNLMKTPLFVIIACAIQMGESSFHPSTQTVLFSTLYELMVEKNRYKTKEITENHIMLSINHCGDLALDGIFDQRFDFQSEDLADIREEVLLASGLLNKYTAQRLKPTYRFFHKSFQEYTAGRKLCKLLTSCQEAEVKKGHSYLQKINSISDITNTYFNLLLYTCGSSLEATRIILDLLKRIDQHREISEKNLALEREYTKKSENITEKADLKRTDKDIFAECVINFFYESSSKSALSRDFEEFFCDKSIFINTQNIPTYFSDFFRYLPNCLSVLGLIKLDFFGNYSPSKEIDSENVEDLQISSLKTYIPEKAVSLFFNWNQSLRSLEITLQDFNKLKKHDIKYLGKICCSAASLKLHISNSAGITGTLNEVLETCKNLRDLTVESTPLTVEDEQQITAMTKLKTLHIRDLQSENLEGGLIDGIKKLVNAEGLVLDNISMYEDDAKKLAEGIRNLRKLRSLYMNHLTAIGDGITYIVRSVSDELSELEEIQLVNCCISSDAVEILAQNLCNLPKLYVLDLSENYLEKKGKDAIHRLVDGLNVLPGMKVLMLPWGDDVKICLTKLLELLETMPQLTKLGLRKWSLTDVEVRILGNFFEKEHLQNLQHLDVAMNCVTSDGWLSFMQPLISLKKLVSVDFSSKQDWVPASLLVCKLSQVLTTLNYLKEIKMTGWKFDCHDLGLINDAKINCRKQFQLVHS